jgi:hypothetical protein
MSPQETRRISTRDRKTNVGKNCDETNRVANTEVRQNEGVAVTNNEIQNPEDAIHNIEREEDRQLHNYIAKAEVKGSPMPPAGNQYEEDNDRTVPIGSPKRNKKIKMEKEQTTRETTRSKTRLKTPQHS